MTPVIRHFDRTTARTIGDRASALLKPLADELGLELRPERSVFDNDHLAFKVSFQLRQVDGISLDEATFKKHAEGLNLLPSHFGHVLPTPHGDARIVALDLKRRKRPIVIEYVTRPGKRYLLEDSYVRRLLGRSYEWEKPATVTRPAAP